MVGNIYSWIENFRILSQLCFDQQKDSCDQNRAALIVDRYPYIVPTVKDYQRPAHSFQPRMSFCSIHSMLKACKRSSLQS